MGRVRFCLCVLLVAGIFSSVVAGQVSSPPKDNGGDIADPERQHVVIPLTAVDRDGRPVSTLKPEDLRLVADGVEHQILALSRQNDRPLSVAVVLDVSASQEKVLPTAKSAALELLSALLRPGRGDSAAVVSFTNKPTLVQKKTDDLAALRRAVEGVRFVPPPGYVGGGILVGTPPPARNLPGSTALWDVLVYACDEVLAPAAAGDRRAIILISDGNDTSSRLKLDGAAGRAVLAGVAVYSIGLGDSNFDEVNKGNLRKISERTGGRAFFPEKVNDLTAILTQISEELQSRYVVTFAPTVAARDGSFHKVKIEIANRALREQGVELAYPQGFYSGNAPIAVKK